MPLNTPENENDTAHGGIDQISHKNHATAENGDLITEHASEEAEEQYHPVKTYLRHAALQTTAVFAVLSIIWPYFIFQDRAMPWPEVSLGIGAVALLIASLTRQPWWWRLIHAAFVPLILLASTLTLHPAWFMLAFITTLLISRGALTGQIPLYFSNRRCAHAVGKLTENLAGTRFIDLGAGIGSMVVPLSEMYPQKNYAGVENAPIPWVIGALRTRRRKNCQWQWGSLWKANLADHDVVYAFLSPAPMAELWQKVQREMKPGSLFISNSFPVPGVEASETLEINDARQTRLFCYRVAAKS